MLIMTDAVVVPRSRTAHRFLRWICTYTPTEFAWLRNIAQYGYATAGGDLHWVLRYVQTLVNTEEDFFEELQPLRLHLLALLEHLRHVFHVLWVVLIDLLKSRLVLLLRLLYLLLRLLHSVLHLLHLSKETRKCLDTLQGALLFNARLKIKALIGTDWIRGLTFISTNNFNLV